MPFDREATLKAAEKALKTGKVDAAVAEYAKIVEAQPRDWNSANTLGDLYVRSNKLDRGIEQYTRIADHLAEEGFYPKAQAVFKKILKLKPDHEYSMLKSGELAARQGTLADAKQFFQQVAERRKARGDKKGEAEIAIKLGTLDPDDIAARMRAGQLAQEIGDNALALREYREIATKLEKAGKVAEAVAPLQLAYGLDRLDEPTRSRLFSATLTTDPSNARTIAKGVDELREVVAALEKAGRAEEALDVLGAIAAADPADLEARANLALTYVSRGDLERARQFLTPETAGSNATLWLTLGEIELRSNRIAEGRGAVVQALTLDRAQAQAAVVLGCKLADVSVEAGYQPVEAVADMALAENDYAAAAVALHEFTTRVRSHLVALMRLVEICVDGGLEATMYEAQAALADAYLDQGRAMEARIISEDLVAREPWNKVNIDRFRRALVMMGESDPDAIISERLSGESPFLATEKMDLNEGETFDTPQPAASIDTTPVAPTADAETDQPAAAKQTVAAEGKPTPPARTLDKVFGGLRDEASRSSDEETAAEQYRLALTYQEMGMADDAITALEQAARSPRQRFDAASMLGRLYLERKDTAHAIEWLERAAEAPSPTQDSGRALLYDLAQLLASTGEESRALAVFVELEAESGGYRDVAGQIARLSKAQARG